MLKMEQVVPDEVDGKDESHGRGCYDRAERLPVGSVAEIALTEADLQVLAGQRLLVAPGQDDLLGVVGNACLDFRFRFYFL